MERYHVDRLLGEGTYGKVCLARVKADNQKVAIKLFKKLRKDTQTEKKKGGSSDNSDHQTQPNEEASILQSLDHPNIIKMLEFISDDDTTAMVMEYAPRGDMLNYMNSRPKVGFPEPISRDYFLQLISAIKYLHDLDYIHCDIKLENILLFHGNVIKLTDFGFAIKYSKTKRMKYGNGSLSYASPEVVFKRDFYGPEADIWSLGVVLFTMICGKFPLDFNKNSVGQAYKTLESQGLSFPESGISIECQDLLVQMLEIYADKRITMSKIQESDWVTNNKSALQPEIVKLNLGKLQAMAPGILTQQSSPNSSKNNTPRTSPGRISPKISPKATNGLKLSPKAPVDEAERSPGPMLKIPINLPRAPSPHSSSPHSSSPHSSSPHSSSPRSSSPRSSSPHSPSRTRNPRLEKDHESIFKSAFRLISPGRLTDQRRSPMKVNDTPLASIMVEEEELVELSNRRIRFNTGSSPLSSPLSSPPLSTSPH